MSTQETGIHAETGSVEAYEFGPFRVDVPARRLSQEDKPISLPSRVFDLLVCFLRHQNQIWTGTPSSERGGPMPSSRKTA